MDIFENDIYNIAFRFMGNHEDACDIAQEAFIRVYKSIKKFRGDSAFSTWLYRIVSNLCYDEMRRRRHPVRSLDEPIFNGNNTLYSELPDDGPSPEEHIEVVERKERIQKAITCLANEYRMVIILKDIQEFSYEEISQILKVPIGTVKSRLSRARAQLKKILVKSSTKMGGAVDEL